MQIAPVSKTFNSLQMAPSPPLPMPMLSSTRLFFFVHTFQGHLFRDQDKPLLGTVFFSPQIPKLGDGETIRGKGGGKFPFYGALAHAKHPTYIHHFILPRRDCFHSCFCTWEKCSLGEGQVSGLLARCSAVSYRLSHNAFPQ